MKRRRGWIVCAVVPAVCWLAAPARAMFFDPPAVIDGAELKAWIIAANSAGKVAAVELRVQREAAPVEAGAWGDPAVVERLGRGDIAVRAMEARHAAELIGATPRTPLARVSLREIRSPGLYAFADAELVLVRHGSIERDDLIRFLDEALASESSLAERRREVEAEQGSVTERILAARTLLVDLARRGLVEEALERTEAYWRDGTLAPEWQARSSHAFLKRVIHSLLDQSPQAAARFSAMRDELEAALVERRASMLDLFDWLLLSGELGDIERIVAWIDRVGDQPAARRLLDDQMLGLFSTLIEAGEWRVAGRALLDPAETARRRAKALVELERMFGPDQDVARSHALAAGRVQFAELYAACLAADRAADAEAVAAVLLEVDDHDSMARIALALAAADAGASQTIHLRWLDEAEREGLTLPDGLRERVAKALNERG